MNDDETFFVRVLDSHGYSSMAGLPERRVSPVAGKHCQSLGPILPAMMAQISVGEWPKTIALRSIIASPVARDFVRDAQHWLGRLTSRR